MPSPVPARESAVSTVWAHLASFPAVRLHGLLYGLLYPAFLGSLIYNHVNEGPPLSTQAVLALALLLVLYSLDYAYALSEEIAKQYSFAQFVADFLVVALLYIAAKSVTGERIIEGFAPWGALAAARAIAAVWEELHRWQLRRASKPPPSRRHANSDWALVLVYLAVGQWGWDAVDLDYLNVLLLVPLALDVFVYIWNMPRT